MTTTLIKRPTDGIQTWTFWRRPLGTQHPWQSYAGLRGTGRDAYQGMAELDRQGSDTEWEWFATVGDERPTTQLIGQRRW